VHTPAEIDKDGTLSAKKAIDLEEIYPVSPRFEKIIVFGEDTLVESEIEISHAPVIVLFAARESFNLIDPFEMIPYCN
jgi:hypothetical protein